jgi:hypothetical protein
MGIRTPDLLNAIEALYQLSYDPLLDLRLKAISNERYRGEEERLGGETRQGNTNLQNLI